MTEDTGEFRNVAGTAAEADQHLVLYLNEFRPAKEKLSSSQE